MKTIKLKSVLSVFLLLSFMVVVGTVNASPVKFNQVIQVVDAKPGKAGNSNFAKLHIAKNDPVKNDPVKNDPKKDGDGDKDKKDGDGDKKTGEETAEATQSQDRRVITTTEIEIGKAEECNCEDAIIAEAGSSFPKWALLGLGAVPIPFIPTGGNSPTPTPTTTTTPTITPPPTTPPPSPTPEPMTLLLFGTGLTGVGFAARKKFGKKDKDSEA